jgi:Tfp pilus assembly protein FimV
MKLAAVDSITMLSIPHPAYGPSMAYAQPLAPGGTAGKAFADVGSPHVDRANNESYSRGDRIGAIAEKYQLPDATIAQKTVIFDAGPQVFSAGNMNLLKTGVKLIMPNRAEVLYTSIPSALATPAP